MLLAEESVRTQHLVRGDAVHRRVYTDPAIFDLEMERIFQGTWVFVAHESEVPQPGDFKTETVGGQPLVITRDSAGLVNVMFNACRHRGATLSSLPCGNTNSLRCPYHGWTYRTDGELTGVPYREGFDAEFRPEDYPLLRPARVDSYQGFIFASMSPDVPDLQEHLGRAAHYMDLMVARAPEGRISAGKALKNKYLGNWKLQLENYSDCYHPTFVHQSLREAQLALAPKGEGLFQQSAGFKRRHEERSFGRGHGMLNFHGSRAAWRDISRDTEYVSALAKQHGPERARELAELDVHVVVYPNLLLQFQLNHYRIIKPVTVDETEIHSFPCRLVGAPDHVNEKILAYTARFVSPGGELQVDDLEAFAHCHAGLRTKALEWIIFPLTSGEEYENEHGELVNEGVSEMIQRGHYREWTRLLSMEG